MSQVSEVGLAKQHIIDACLQRLYAAPIMDALKRRDVIIIKSLQFEKKPLNCTAHVFCEEGIVTRRIGSGNAQSVYLDLPTYLEDAMMPIQAEIDDLDQEQSLVEAHLTRLLNLVDTDVEGRKAMHHTLMDSPGVISSLSGLKSIVGQVLEAPFLDEIKAFHVKEEQYSNIIKERLLTNLLIQG